MSHLIPSCGEQCVHRSKQCPSSADAPDTDLGQILQVQRCTARADAEAQWNGHGLNEMPQGTEIGWAGDEDTVGASSGITVGSFNGVRKRISNASEVGFRPGRDGEVQQQIVGSLASGCNVFNRLLNRDEAWFLPVCLVLNAAPDHAELDGGTNRIGNFPPVWSRSRFRDHRLQAAVLLTRFARIRRA